MWKFQTFSTTQILRETNIGDSRSAIILHLEILNFDFYAFSQFLKVEIYQIVTFRAPLEIAKTAVF